MQISKLVSILIPVYNRENLIEETINSALNQTYKNIEIIVVDNKSTDKTWKIIQLLAKNDDRIKTYQNKKNIGPVKNWEQCIRKASGIYGKILWSDDLIALNFIEKTLPYIEKNKDVGFVFTGTEIFDTEKNQKNNNYFIGSSGLYNCEDYITGVLFRKNYPVSPGCAIFRLTDLKKNLILDIPNKLNSNFSKHAIGNDLLLYLLTANEYKNFAFVNEKLSFFRAHSDSISISSDTIKLKLFYTLTKAYFIEKYRYNYEIEYLNNYISKLLKNKQTKKYGASQISDFYLENKNYAISKNIINNANIDFSIQFNQLVSQINNIKSKKIIIYGCGTIGKIIFSLIPERIIAFVDISSNKKFIPIENNSDIFHPSNLHNMKFEKIIISVLGREDKIIDYLINELAINRKKIIEIDLS